MKENLYRLVLSPELCPITGQIVLYIDLRRVA